MNLQIHYRRNFKMPPKSDEQKIAEWAQSKFNKLDKYFKDDTLSTLFLCSEKGDKYRAEGSITTNSSTLIFRAESVHADPLVAIDNVVKSITRQIAKNKTRLSKSLRDGSLSSPIPVEDTGTETEEAEEREFKIVRNKRFDIKPMSPEEAILQMNLLGHEFFLFQEATTLKTNLVYKRRAGDYGLIVV
jgi:putative sigma-54 modulation protein